MLLSTRSREFIVGSKLTAVKKFIVAIYNFPERVCPMLLVTKLSVTMPCETHVLRKLKIPMAVYILPAKGYRFYSMLSWVSCGRNKIALKSGR